MEHYFLNLDFEIKLLIRRFGVLKIVENIVIIVAIVVAIAAAVAFTGVVLFLEITLVILKNKKTF